MSSSKPKWTAPTLLAHLLGRSTLAPEDIDDLATRSTDEGLHLEYKRGDWLHEKDAAYQLRRYVSGFANADGGTIIIGVDAETARDANRKPTGPWTVTGCAAQVGPLDEWASNALTDIASYLSPPPAIDVVQHAKGPVLIVAVARAPNLVALGENKRMVFYLRLGHQTLKVPEYLHADLVLGRRSHPEVRMHCDLASVGEFPSPAWRKLTLLLTFANEGLSWVSKASWGWVGYCDASRMLRTPTHSLWRYIANKGTRGVCGQQSVAMDMRDLEDDLAPFTWRQRESEIVTAFAEGQDFVWKGVLFFLPHNSPPSFVQLEYGLNRGLASFRAKPLAPGELGEISIVNHPTEQ